MGLDVYLMVVKPTSVFEANYTHNVAEMAREAGLYEAVWRPEEKGFTRASHLAIPLRDGIAKMAADPDKFRALNPKNGWGSYDTFLPWLRRYLAACEENPDATIEVSR